MAGSREPGRPNIGGGGGGGGRNSSRKDFTCTVFFFSVSRPSKAATSLYSKSSNYLISCPHTVHLSPGVYIFQRTFLRGLYTEGLIIGGDFAFRNRLGL